MRSSCHRPGRADPSDRSVDAPYAEKHGLDFSQTIDDRTFARRLYYDLIGLPPTPEELQAFLSDPPPTNAIAWPNPYGRRIALCRPLAVILE